MADRINQVIQEFSFDSRFVTVLGSVTNTPFLADPRRVTLMVSNNGPDTVQVYIGPTTSPLSPVFVKPVDPPLILPFRDFGPYMQGQVNLLAPGGTAGVSVFTIFKSS